MIHKQISVSFPLNSVLVLIIVYKFLCLYTVCSTLRVNRTRVLTLDVVRIGTDYQGTKVLCNLGVNIRRGL